MKKCSGFLWCCIVAACFFYRVELVYSAYYFTDTFDCIDNTFWSETQEAPSLDFDSDGSIHLAWSDTRSSGGFNPPYIMQRMYIPGSGFTSTALVPYDSLCGSSNCVLNHPEVCFHRLTSSPYGYFLFSSNAFSEVQGDLWEYGGTWTPLSSLPGDDANPSISTVSEQGDLFLAISNHSSTEHAVKLYKYEGGIGWTDSFVYEDTVNNWAFSNAFIEMDDTGFLYLVFYVSNSTQDGLYACRSTNPLDISSWNPPRLVFLSGTSIISRMDVVKDSNNVLVAVAFTSGSSVLCITEESGDWTSGSSFSGTPQMVNLCTTCTPSTPDLTVINEGQIFVVWSETDFGPPSRLYSNISYNKGESFTGMREILSEGLTSASNPRIASFESLDNVAIVCEATIDGHDTIAGFFDFADFYDNCDDAGFSNWTTVSSVSIDDSFSHDSNGSSFKFSGAIASIEKTYGEENKGSIDFWFHDDLSQDADFTFEVSGQNDAKGGVRLLMGIRGEVEPDKYSINIVETKDWEPIPSPVGDRTLGWHHVVVLIDPEKDIELYLDPETYTSPVVSSGEVDFNSFHSLSFTGGDPASSGAYHVDDVRVVASPLPTMDLPAITLWGFILLLSAYFVIIKRK